MYLLLRRLRDRQNPSLWPSCLTASLAIAAHGTVLASVFVRAGGVDLSFFHALSLVAWLMAVMQLIGAARGALQSLGLVLFPMAAVALALDSMWGSALPHTAQTWQIQTHAVFALLSYATLSLAAVQALVLASQDYVLKNPKYLGWLSLFPPLQRMESLLFQIIAAGTLLLSLTLVSGGLFVEDLLAQHLAHKTVLSVIAWMIFATLLWGRRRFGWRGRKAVRLTLTGMALLLLAYFGSKLVLELILQGG